MSRENPLVLFLCTGNSARSIMAEAMLRHHAGDRFRVCSSGLEPVPVNPLTLQVLEEKGVDTSGLHSKSTSRFLGKAAVDYAIIVCEKAQQHCPRIYPFALHVLYWPFEDPAAVQGSERERLQKFREVRDRIEHRIVEWVDELEHAAVSERTGSWHA